MTDTTSHKAARGAVWATIERFGFMGFQFIVNLVLANLLMPEAFGVVGMLMIFIAVSNVMVDSGFGSALLQKKNPDQTDYSTVFWWNISFAAILYLIVFAASPLVADFYRMPQLTSVLRIFALTLLTNGIFTIQVTRLRKQLEFKKIAISNIAAYFCASTIGILLALNGFGVWSLVLLQLLYGAFYVVYLQIASRWLPSLTFSKNSMKELFGFGGFIMAAAILQEICNNMQGMIIGRKFSASQMGYYSQAAKLENVSCNSLAQALVQVMYPVYSSLQDDKTRLVNTILMNVRVVSFITFPLIAIFILIGGTIIPALYGEKWIPSIPYFQILCVGGFFACLQNINFYAVAAKGKSKHLFYWSIYKWTFLLASIFIGAIWGMYGIIWGRVISSANIYLVNASLASRHVGVSLISQLLTLLPVSATTAISYASAMALDASPTATTLIFVIVYGLLSVAFNKESIGETYKIFLKVIHKG